MSFAKTLSRDEMKNVKAGVSSQCNLYCCSGSGGCSEGISCDGCGGASSHSGCQSAAVDAGYVCQGGGYVAALYK